MERREYLSRALIALAFFAQIGAAGASPTFQGRLADGTHSSTCTVSGVDKCAMFYNTTLDITILNDWNIGTGNWFEWIPDSAQALVRTEGAAQTDFSGWVLPQLNQLQSIWNEVGRTTAGLVDQFDGVRYDGYWSGTELYPYYGWFFNVDGSYGVADKEEAHYAVAVRPGDVSPPEPNPTPATEPATLTLIAGALLGIATTRRRKSMAPSV